MSRNDIRTVVDEKYCDKSSESIIITGARGRIAQSISKIVEDNFRNIVKISRTSGDGYISHNDAVESDLFKGASVIIHTAWSSVPLISETHPGIEWKNDLPYLAEVLNIIKDTSKPKPLFIFLSSAGTVYGNALGRASLESDTTNPIGWYGRGKVAAEKLCSHFADAFEIPLLILRVSNPYGFQLTCNKPQGLIAATLRAAKTGSLLKVWGDGSALKDFIHYQDFANAICLAINLKLTGLYNLGYGKSYKVNDVFSIIQEITKKKLLLDFEFKPSWDVTDSRINCDSLFDHTQWRANIDLVDGIQLCINS